MKAPFTGDVFDLMVAEDVGTIAGGLVHSGGKQTVSDYKKIVKPVLLAYLEYRIAGTVPVYHAAQSDAEATELKIANHIGVTSLTTGAILGEMEIASYDGRISGIYDNPQGSQALYTQGKSIADSLKPSFVTRVLSTMIKPLGIDVEWLASAGKWIVIILALIATIYVFRFFKR